MRKSEKKELNEFAKWLAEMPNSVDPSLVHLYHRAVICKAFPAYTLEMAREAPARDLFVAMQLLNAADQMRQ